MNNDGFVDIITGAGATGGPHVKVFDGQTGATTASFFAFDSGFSGGVRVASVDFDNDGDDDIVVGRGPTSPPEVKILDGLTAAQLDSFFAFDAAFDGGIFVG